jgi:hypothetical protein
LGTSPPLATLLAPLLVAVLVAATWAVVMRSPERLDEVNATTLWMFFASTVTPVIAVATLAIAFREAFDNDVSLLFRIHLLLLGIAGGVLSTFAWIAHWVALRTWAW